MPTFHYRRHTIAIQTIPSYLQNSSHSSADFRQASSAPFTTGGILGVGELGVTAQATPNMSVLVAAGRAMVVGNSVTPPTGFTWTTQAMYGVLNDAPATVTINTADATNPRIDLVYVQVQDAYYSGAANQAVLLVVTGTPAATPFVPATPANSIALATVAVAANVTSIVSGNIAISATVASINAAVKGITAVKYSTTSNVSMTNQTAYGDLPSPFAAAMLINFTKVLASTKLVIHIDMALWLNSGTNQNAYVGINIDGTDYEVGVLQFGTASASTIGMVTGTVVVTGLAAGVHAIKPRFMAQTASVFEIITSNTVSYQVTESA